LLYPQIPVKALYHDCARQIYAEENSFDNERFTLCNTELVFARTLSAIRRFFLQPAAPKQRQYEALRAYFVEGRPAQAVATAFGYSPGAFHVLCHHFRRDPAPAFFLTPRRGPRSQPKKSAARDLLIRLRKQNHSVYEISHQLKEQGCPLSPTAVREVLKAEGFAPLPRRADAERPDYPRPTVEAVADVRQFALSPHRSTTAYGGLFLFVPDLIRLGLEPLAQQAGLPGSKLIPAAHALRASLALKLWSLERKSHAMALVADEGLGLFAGLNAFPKKSFLSEYSCRIEHAKTLRVLAAWHAQTLGEPLFPGQSFNLDFHSVPDYGAHPLVERHYVSMRSRRQPSVLVFLAQDAGSHAFCYANADLRKGEEAEEVFAFVNFWKRTHGGLPRHLVFDSKLTTYAGLARLDRLGIAFITLRRRSPKLLKEVVLLPRSAWRTIELDVPTRQYRTPRYHEHSVVLAGCKLRQLLVQDLGHDEPTILLTNQRHAAPKALLTRYAQRMLIENALSEAVRFFHLDALSSAVGLKVDFDMALLVLASGLYRRLAQRMRGYADAQARQIFRDLINLPATVTVSAKEVEVSFHRRSHLPILLASGLFEQPVPVPWWGGHTLRLTTYSSPATPPAS
jgi:transposase